MSNMDMCRELCFPSVLRGKNGHSRFVFFLRLWPWAKAKVIQSDIKM